MANSKSQSIEEVKKVSAELTKKRFEEARKNKEEQHKTDGNNQPVKK